MMASLIAFTLDFNTSENEVRREMSLIWTQVKYSSYNTHFLVKIFTDYGLHIVDLHIMECIWSISYKTYRCRRDDSNQAGNTRARLRGTSSAIVVSRLFGTWPLLPSKTLSCEETVSSSCSLPPINRGLVTSSICNDMIWFQKLNISLLVQDGRQQDGPAELLPPPCSPLHRRPRHQQGEGGHDDGDGSDDDDGGGDDWHDDPKVLLSSFLDSPCISTKMFNLKAESTQMDICMFVAYRSARAISFKAFHLFPTVARTLHVLLSSHISKMHAGT